MAAKTILVVVDPEVTEKQPVVERAAWLARRVGAGLELFACEYDSTVETGRIAKAFGPAQSARDRLSAVHLERLEALARPLRAQGIDVTVSAVWASPLGEAIVRRVAATSPWLVAKDTFHHNIVQRTLLSSTDWDLIRNCAVPLLFVKPREIAAAPKIMVAVDPLHEHDKPVQLDDALFSFAQGLARSTHGQLHVTHAVSMPMGLQLPPDVAKVVQREHAGAMNDFLRKHEVPPANVHVLTGLAHECLQSAVTEHAADFLVMGAIARRGLRRVIIGSTADRALDRLSCDVIIIKPAGFAATKEG